MYVIQFGYFKIGFSHNCIIHLLSSAQRRASVAVNFLYGNVSFTFGIRNKYIKTLCSKMHSLNLTIDGAYIYYCAF
jgi:hypothetical protein